MCNITFTRKSYFCGSGEIVRGQTTAICTVVTFGLEVISLQMALLAFTNSFLCLTSWAVSFFSLANSFESLANCFSELANCFRQLLITMPWFRLRHHFRHFFRQFISSDMMIFQIDMVQRKGERLQRLLPYRRLQFTFPYHDGMPSHFSQPVQHLMVPLPVPSDLLHPEPGVRFRHHIIFAPLMSVPEAPVHQNTGAIFPQHDVRLARQPRVIEPIPESPTPQKFPDKNLRLGIPAPYCRHIVMALFYG